MNNFVRQVEIAEVNEMNNFGWWRGLLLGKAARTEIRKIKYELTTARDAGASALKAQNVEITEELRRRSSLTSYVRNLQKALPERRK